LLTAVVMLTLSLLASFITALKISTLIRLITYGTTCLALMKLRREADAPEATFTVPGGPAVVVAALALTAWLLLSSTWMEAFMVAAAAILGMLVYAARRLMAGDERGSYRQESR
jgi:amino acid transporter